MKPRVVVVMPFGVKAVCPAAPATVTSAATPVVSVNFDAVYEQLVKPALIAAGCQPFRADEETVSGDIRTDMFYELVTADGVVADLSAANLNVFYELGVRHGVTPKGAVLIHGEWGRAPFDVMSDRRFTYPGKLFVHPLEPIPDDAIAAAVSALAIKLSAALNATAESTGSPVYKELPGLVPADWTRITNARSVFFGDFMEKWRTRVAVARAACRPGDILTLSDDAPTRYHHGVLAMEAAGCMIDLHLFDLAWEMLHDLLKEQPGHFKANCQFGLVLGRLGRLDEARVHMQSVARAAGSDPEAQGVLARVYKDLWRLRWDAPATVEDRRRLAAEHASLAGDALEGYAQAFEHNLDSYYNGVNVVTLAKLLGNIGAKGRSDTVHRIMREVGQLTVIVKKAAECAVEQAGDNKDERIWACATLGELAVIENDAGSARDHYGRAADIPGISIFQIESMASQLRLLERLGFQPESVQAALQTLELRRAGLTPPSRTRGRVLVFSGHMTDVPGRIPERFPERKEAAAREGLDSILTRWGFGAGDLAIGGGARGGDTIISELCVARGVKVRQLIALPQGEFLAKSVRTPGSRWQERYLALAGQVERRFQPEALGDAPRWINAFERNNRWCLNTARAEAATGRLYSLLVWDEQPAGDGPGGTSHFAMTTATLGTQGIVNPTALP